MNNPLVVYRHNYRGGSAYFGEHAEIMRLIYNIPDEVTEIVERKIDTNR